MTRHNSCSQKLELGFDEEVRVPCYEFLVPGLLFGWLALWDLALIHRRDVMGVVLQVLVMAAGVVLVWLWMRYWDRLVACLP